MEYGLSLNFFLYKITAMKSSPSPMGFLTLYQSSVECGKLCFSRSAGFYSNLCFILNTNSVKSCLKFHVSNLFKLYCEKVHRDFGVHCVPTLHPPALGLNEIKYLKIGTSHDFGNSSHVFCTLDRRTKIISVCCINLYASCMIVMNSYDHISTIKLSCQGPEHLFTDTCIFETLHFKVRLHSKARFILFHGHLRHR
jgi:hypothetical protein